MSEEVPSAPPEDLELVTRLLDGDGHRPTLPPNVDDVPEQRLLSSETIDRVRVAADPLSQGSRPPSGRTRPASHVGQRVTVASPPGTNGVMLNELAG